MPVQPKLLHVEMETAFKGLGDVMELMTALTGVMNRTAVSHWWNFRFRVAYLILSNIETDSRVDFMVCYG